METSQDRSYGTSKMPLGHSSFKIDQIVGLILRSARCTSKFDPGINFPKAKKASASKSKVPLCIHSGSQVFLQQETCPGEAKTYVHYCTSANDPTKISELGAWTACSCGKGRSGEVSAKILATLCIFLIPISFQNHDTTLTNPCTC